MVMVMYYLIFWKFLFKYDIYTKKYTSYHGYSLTNIRKVNRSLLQASISMSGILSTPEPLFNLLSPKYGWKSTYNVRGLVLPVFKHFYKWNEPFSAQSYKLSWTKFI